MPEPCAAAENLKSLSQADERPGFRGFLTGVVMFILGGCGLAYEYTFSKLASDLLGNTVQQWAIVIALMLFAMGMGAELQRHIRKERIADRLIESQFLLALFGGFGPIALLAAFAFAPMHFALVQYGFCALIGLLIGLEIPLIIRINESGSSDMRLNLARVLKMDYIGALVGALLWVFLLIKIFSITQIGFVLGLTTLATAAFCLYLFREHVQRPLRAQIMLGVGVLASLYGLALASQWTLHAEQALFRDKVILSETTRYQHLVVTEGKNGDTHCYINGNLQFSSADEFIYHENLVHPAMALAPRRERILILGGGDGLALREVLKYPDVREVVLVDIDPEMTRLAREDPWLTQMNHDSLADARVTTLENQAFRRGERYTLQATNQRVRFDRESDATAELEILHLDAATFVRQATGRFQVAIIDFPDPNSPDLAKLYGLPFYQALKQRLTADGIFVQQSTSPVHAKEAFLCIGRTMEAAGFAALPYHDNVPSFGEWGWWIGGAGELYRPEKLRSILLGIENVSVETRYLTPDLIRASLHFGKTQLTTEETSITTLTDSNVLQYYLQAWKATH